MEYKIQYKLSVLHWTLRSVEASLHLHRKYCKRLGSLLYPRPVSNSLATP